MILTRLVITEELGLVRGESTFSSSVPVDLAMKVCFVLDDSNIGLLMASGRWRGFLVCLWKHTPRI